MPWGNRDYHPLSEPNRFWWNIDYTGSPIGCWIWLGCKVPPHYYGMLNVNGKNRKAYRYAWELTNGPIPDGLWVLHKCDNPPCVRPDHLFLGTRKDNVQDAISKGRWASVKGESNPHAKLSEIQIRQIRQKFIRYPGYHKTNLAELAKEYGVTKTMISFIVRRKNWK